MKKVLKSILLISLFSFFTCDDGDVITFELDFEDTFLVCGDNDLVFYKTKSNPAESLSLVVSGKTLDEFFDVDVVSGTKEIVVELNSNNFLNYRTYNNATLPSNLFCNLVPNSSVSIKNDVLCSSGTATFKTTLIEDDNDGIEASLEDINKNGDLKDDDTDGDGMSNYIDFDDDGDNVPTKSENPIVNESLANAQDSDADGTPDYLDADDDNDGINTRDEENESQDLNPMNDVTFSEIGADYLNHNVANINTPKATQFRVHTINQKYTLILTIKNFDLQKIAIDTFDFGILKDEITSNTKSITPNFK